MNKSKRMKHAHIARLAAASALLLIAAGCQSGDKPYDISGTTVAKEDIAISAEGPQKSYLEDSGDISPVYEAPPGDESDASLEASSAHSGTAPTDELFTEDSTRWSADSFYLHGVAIGDSGSAIAELHGNELDSYKLEEEHAAVDVLEYDGFSIGLNEAGYVHFVEVYSRHVSAGLNGLRVGDSPDKAVSELGNPGTQSDYLLTYDVKGGLLKLDIDPMMNEIVSIKLLSQG